MLNEKNKMFEYCHKHKSLTPEASSTTEINWLFYYYETVTINLKMDNIFIVENIF